MLLKDICFTQFKQLKNHLLQYLLPPACVLCGYLTRTNQNLCLACKKDLPILSQKCEKCARFLPGEPSSAPLICGICLKVPPPFSRTHALFSYDAPIVKLIIKLKFQHDLSIAKALGELIIEQIPTWYKDQALPDLIIPTPLHIKRLRERGFNQIIEIAKPVAAFYHLPMDKMGVKRIKDTKAQSSLLAKDRESNMKNAFLTTRRYTDMSLAIIDDVITTGNTIFELANTLKAGGAKKIDVWCCARR